MRISLLATMLLSCCFAARSPAAPLTRSQVLATAAAYAEYAWQPTERNVLHGLDRDGIDVQTPDASTGNPDLWQAGEASKGVPYKWGGFDSLESFDRGIRAGKAAGDIYTPDKRRLVGKAVSSQAVGLDCSGFISRCWRLEKKYSTDSLPGLCVRLGSLAELRPGDILDRPGGHVSMFFKWLDDTQTRFLCYEGEPFSRVRCRERDAQQMVGIGYLPMRYRGIVD